MDNSYLVLLGFIAVCVAAASTGAIFRPGDWYENLAKPKWRPPNWLFGPVWMVLYAMIAVSGWFVWEKAGFAGATLALLLFAVQLALNALWSMIFFGMRRIGLAAAEMGLLWIAIAATIVAFYPIDETAAWLLVPYIVWVSLAFTLNLSIWRMNRHESRVRPAEAR